MLFSSVFNCLLASISLLSTILLIQPLNVGSVRIAVVLLCHISQGNTRRMVRSGEDMVEVTQIKISRALFI